MEAAELRIGNIVDQGSYGPTPCTAYEIYNYSLYKKGGRVAEYYKQWKPILLDGGWMLNLGLIQFMDHFSIEHGPWHYSVQRHPSYSEGWILFIDVTDVAAPPSMKVKYVHQLQNLYFFLTGMEEELILSNEAVSKTV